MGSCSSTNVTKDTENWQCFTNGGWVSYPPLGQTLIRTHLQHHGTQGPALVTSGPALGIGDVGAVVVDTRRMVQHTLARSVDDEIRRVDGAGAVTTAPMDPQLIHVLSQPPPASSMIMTSCNVCLMTASHLPPCGTCGCRTCTKCLPEANAPCIACVRRSDRLPECVVWATEVLGSLAAADVALRNPVDFAYVHHAARVEVMALRAEAKKRYDAVVCDPLAAYHRIPASPIEPSRDEWNARTDRLLHQMERESSLSGGKLELNDVRAAVIGGVAAELTRVANEAAGWIVGSPVPTNSVVAFLTSLPRIASGRLTVLHGLSTKMRHIAEFLQDTSFTGRVGGTWGITWGDHMDVISVGYHSDAATAGIVPGMVLHSLDGVMVRSLSEMETRVGAAVKPMKVTFAWEGWPRWIAGSASPSHVVEGITAAYVYSLDAPYKFYAEMNLALRMHDAAVLLLYDAVLVALDGFCARSPGTSGCLFRGMSHRAVYDHHNKVGNTFPAAQFVSASRDAAVAYSFIRGDRTGTYFIFVGAVGMDLGIASDFPGESEVLMSRHEILRTSYIVPESHLSIIDQPFHVVECQSASLSEAPSSARVRAVLEGTRAASMAYREVQEWYVEPQLVRARDNAVMSVREAITGMFRPGGRWMFVSGGAGMGKSTLSIMGNSFVCCESHHGYYSIIVPLPELTAGSVFSANTLELFLQRRLHITAEDLSILRSVPLLLVMDSLDEVHMAAWPTTAALGGGSMHDADRWPMLRTLVTCREEHLLQHRLDIAIMTSARADALAIAPYSHDLVNRFLDKHVGGKTAERAAAWDTYQLAGSAFQTPFLLYLLVCASSKLVGRTATVWDVYLEGVKTLVEHNVLRTCGGLTLYAVDDALYASMRLALHLVTRDRWKADVHDLAVCLPGALPNHERVLCGPFRTSGMSFDFRHKSVAEFLVACALTHSGPNILGDMQAEEDIRIFPLSRHPNIERFCRMAPRSPGVLDSAAWGDASLAVIGVRVDELSMPHVHLLSGRALRTLLIETAWEATAATATLIGRHGQHLYALGAWSATDTSISDAAVKCDKLQHLDVSNTQGRVTDTAIRNIAAKCPNLQHLDVSLTWGRVTDASIRDVAVKCANLQYLNVHRTEGKITDSSIREVAVKCHNLQHLDVSNTHGKVTDAAIKDIVAKCTKLQHLDVGCTQGKITDASIQNCAQLRHLNVSHTDSKITDSSIREVAGKCPNLQHLDVSFTRIGDEAIRDVAGKCPNLQHLNLGNTTISDASIRDVAANCAKLQYLDVSSTKGRITDEAIRELAVKCGHLQHLDVADTTITDAAIRDVAGNCPNLHHLDVRHTKITDASIKDVAAFCANLLHLDVSDTTGKITDASIKDVAGKCPHLRYLNVSLTEGMITDASISCVAAMCPDLQHLDVSHTRSMITDISIHKIAGKCPNLRYLNVSLTEGKITDAAIQRVAAMCPRLQHLNVSSTSIADVAIRDVATKCAGLKHLNMSNTTVTDGAVKAVANNCPNLQHLDVSKTDGKITDAAIRLVAGKCPNLQHINVSFTEGEITDAAIQDIAMKCPHLQHLDVSHTKGKITDAAIQDVAATCPCLQHLNVCNTQVTDASIPAIAKCPNLQYLDVSFNNKITDISLKGVSRKCVVKR